MAKIDIGFRFRREVVERLGALAQEQGITRTAVLEGLVLGVDRGAPSEHLIDRGSPVPPKPRPSRKSAASDMLLSKDKWK